jgi:hypothetical protein
LGFSLVFLELEQRRKRGRRDTPRAELFCVAANLNGRRADKKRISYDRALNTLGAGSVGVPARVVCGGRSLIFFVFCLIAILKD